MYQTLGLIGLVLVNSCEQKLETGEKSCSQEFDFNNTSATHINVTVDPDFTLKGDEVKLYANGTNFYYIKPFGWIWFEDFDPERVEIYYSDVDLITNLKIETDLQFEKGGYYVIINEEKQASLVELYPSLCNDLITYE